MDKATNISPKDSQKKIFDFFKRSPIAKNENTSVNKCPGKLVTETGSGDDFEDTRRNKTIQRIKSPFVKQHSNINHPKRKRSHSENVSSDDSGIISLSPNVTISKKKLSKTSSLKFKKRSISPIKSSLFKNNSQESILVDCITSHNSKVKKQDLVHKENTEIVVKNKFSPPTTSNCQKYYDDKERFSDSFNDLSNVVKDITITEVEIKPFSEISNNCSFNSPENNRKLVQECCVSKTRRYHGNKLVRQTLEVKSNCIEEDATTFEDLNNFDILFGDELLLPEEPKTEEKLNLEMWQSCVILNVIKSTPGALVLKLKSTTSEDTATCTVKHAWSQIRLEKNAKVNILAVKTDQDTYEINNAAGILILEPDTLASGTTLMSSLYCQRKTVINTIYGATSAFSPVMTYGHLLHELLQEALRRKIFTTEAIRILFDNIVTRETNIREFYECEMKTSQILKDMQPFFEKISEFIQTYLVRSSDNSNQAFLQRGLKKGNWDGYITNIHDIEENVWCPRLGLKGKIDVSVNVKCNKKKITNKDKPQVIPLEIKTGRAALTAEHQGQVALYNLMLRELGFDSPSGLLLYLKDNIIKEINVGRAEERDLMILRNNLVYYLSKKPVITKASEGNVKKDSQEISVKLTELPKPLCNERKCNNCEQLTMCSFLDRLEENPSNYYQIFTAHLTDQHIKYFKHWINSIQIETSGEINNLYKPASDIWSYTPSQREDKGRSLSNLIIQSVTFQNGNYNTVFVDKDSLAKRDFMKFGFATGMYLVVSTVERVGVAAGFVININEKSISVSLERNLNERYLKDIFCLDNYDTHSHGITYLSSLHMLMKDNLEAKRLREFIIENKKPLYNYSLSNKVKKHIHLIKHLNQMQQKTILHCLATEDYLLINGMPGTGKTKTIVALIEILYLLNKRILITSHTHSAVNNVLEKLLNSNQIDLEKVLKIGSELRATGKVQERTETQLIKNFTNVEDLEKFYKNIKIVGVTCYACDHPLFKHEKFDVCIVDESTQVVQPLAIRPLLAAKMFILLGDPEQLPPVVCNPNARKMGFDESLFDRLYDPNCTEILALQYRMNSAINELVNKYTYKGSLICGNEQVANATFELKQPLSSTTEDWIRTVCDTTLENAVQFLDTDDTTNLNIKYFSSIEKRANKLSALNTKQSKDFSYRNICEAGIVYTLAKTLVSVGVDINEIGIISPYHQQALLLKTLFSNDDSLGGQVEINTIDQYQGRDKNIIIISCATTKFIDSEHDNYIINDRRRLNVALTRAKHKLILVGYRKSLESFPTFQRLFTCLPTAQIIQLRENENQFSWKPMLRQMFKSCKLFN